MPQRRRSKRPGFGKRKSAKSDESVKSDVAKIESILSPPSKSKSPIISNPMPAPSKADESVSDEEEKRDPDGNPIDEPVQYKKMPAMVPPDVVPADSPRRSSRLKEKYAVKPRRVLDESGIWVTDNLGQLDEIIDVPVLHEKPHDMDDMASLIADGVRVDLHNLTEQQRRNLNSILKAANKAKSDRESIKLSDKYRIDEDVALALQDPDIPRDRSDFDQYETPDYLLRNRIYQRELLTDPAIKEAHKFTIKSILNNQLEWPEYVILRNHLKSVDVRNEIESLPDGVRRNIKSNKYSLNKDDLIIFTGSDGIHRICLPPEHRKAIIRWTHCNMITGGHAGITAVTEEIKRRFYWSGYQKGYHRIY